MSISRLHVITGKSERVKYKRSKRDLCVAHLINCKVECGAEHNPTKIEDHISLNHYDLWSELQYGDMVYNAAENRAYFVTHNDQTEGEYLVRNGLSIVDSEYDCQSVPYGFFAITSVPVDQYGIISGSIKINNTYVDGEFDWECTEMPIDVVSLCLDSITHDEVYCLELSEAVYHTIVSYDDINYMICTDSQSVSEHIDALRSNAYHHITLLNDKYDSRSDTVKINKYLRSESVKRQNALVLD